VLRGLETPSYRDVIQNAAISAAIQQPDSGLVAAIGRQAGGQELPATALAALTARGDSTARRVLVGLLDDEREWVRGWAISALEDQLDPPAAAALLREAQPTLTRAEARTAVTEAIGRLGRPPT
jgi:HEAT repeat protein